MNEPSVQPDQGSSPENSDLTRIKKIFQGPLRVVCIVLLVLGAAVFGVSKLGGDFLSEATQEIEFQAATTTFASMESQAPKFSLRNGEGKEIGISEYRGRPIVLLFWASWNAASLDQVSVLDRVSLPGDVVVLTVNTQEDLVVARKAIERGKYALPVLYDEDGRVGELYAARNLPALYFIDRKGDIRAITVGTISGDMIKQYIETIIR